MIVSASRRTDLPAFHGDWFSQRLVQGYVDVANPFNSKQVRRVSLSPTEVDLMVFWTRQADPFWPQLEQLDQMKIPYYFLHTLTAYREELEPGLPGEEQRLESFIRLSKRLGPERVIWRYDPIIISSLTPNEYHRRAFDRLSGMLAGHTRRVHISLVQYYRKVDRRLRVLEKQGVDFERQAAQQPETFRLLESINTMAQNRGMTAYTCAAEVDYRSTGIEPGACIDPALANNLFGLKLEPAKDPGQRSHCRCAPARDIGTNNTCAHGCLYCYANR